MAKLCRCGKPKPPGKGRRSCDSCLGERASRNNDRRMIKYYADPAYRNRCTARSSATRLGLTVDQVLELWAQPGCDACGGPPEGKGRFHIDHDHETGVIRGVLCQGCNLALGHIRDSPERLRKLAGYLEGR